MLRGGMDGIKESIREEVKDVGIRLPKGFRTTPKVYDYLEAKILNKICKPLRLTGMQFDRMLFQNYDKIMEMKFKAG
jgi:hypothetical protein